MKQHAPAAERNREPILAVLREVLPTSGRVLEIASGTGQHAVHFARGLPEITWQPSDPDPAALASIGAWRLEAGLPNLRPPLRLEVTEPQWPVDRADAVVCINMIHIAPWSACEGLVAGAAGLVPEGGTLFLYGPFFRDEVQTAASNLSFDAGLRARNPAWGVRRLDDVERAAAAHGWTLSRIVDMPSNNSAVVFRRQPG